MSRSIIHYFSHFAFLTSLTPQPAKNPSRINAPRYNNPKSPHVTVFHVSALQYACFPSGLILHRYKASEMTSARTYSFQSRISGTNRVKIISTSPNPTYMVPSCERMIWVAGVMLIRDAAAGDMPALRV